MKQRHLFPGPPLHAHFHAGSESHISQQAEASSAWEEVALLTVDNFSFALRSLHSLGKDHNHQGDCCWPRVTVHLVSMPGAVQDQRKSRCMFPPSKEHRAMYPPRCTDVNKATVMEATNLVIRGRGRMSTICNLGSCITALSVDTHASYLPGPRYPCSGPPL